MIDDELVAETTLSSIDCLDVELSITPDVTLDAEDLMGGRVIVTSSSDMLACLVWGDEGRTEVDVRYFMSTRGVSAVPNRISDQLESWAAMKNMQITLFVCKQVHDKHASKQAHV